MQNLTKYRYLVMSSLGILSLTATAASSAPRTPQNTQAVTDVSLSMVADRNTVKLGQNVAYTVTMTNRGPDGATFVDTAFTLPDGIRIVSMTCDEGISPDGPFCEYSSLPSGASVVSTLVATPQAGSPARARLVMISASALFENQGAFDPDTSNNTASVKTKIIGRVSQP